VAAQRGAAISVRPLARTVDVSRHSGVLRTFDFEREGAELVAHGAVPDDVGWRFRRWRFNRG